VEGLYYLIVEGDSAGFLAVFVPFYKVGERANDRGVVINKASVKVAESEEDLNIAN
jgi:hypothetical protein